MNTFMRMDDVMPLLRRQPTSGQGVELFLKQTVNRQWSLAGGQFQTEDGREQGGAIRVVLPDGRSSLVTITRPCPAQLPLYLDQAVEQAGHAAPDPHLILAGPPQERSGDPPFCTYQGPPPVLGEAAETQNLLVRVLETGNRLAGTGARFRRAWINQGELVTELANTSGFVGHQRSGWFSLGLLLAGESGETEPLIHEQLFTCGQEPDTDRFIEDALTRATGLFGALAGTGKEPQSLVLTPEAAAPMLLALGSRFVASPCGSTPTKTPAPGTRVARDEICLLDDGRHPGGLRSGPFDGEGTETRTTILVRDGIFQTMVHDCRTASRFGTVSTGNGVRDSYRQWPAPGLTTLVLRTRPGRSREDLLGTIPSGYYAVDAAPPDPDRLEAGLLSIRLRGRLIRHGRLHSPASPVRLRVPLDRLLPLLAGTAGRPKLVALDGCVESPLVRLDDVKLESC